MGFPWKPPFTILGIKNQFQFSQGILTLQSPPEPRLCVSHLQGTVPNRAADTQMRRRDLGLSQGFPSALVLFCLVIFLTQGLTMLPGWLWTNDDPPASASQMLRSRLGLCASPVMFLKLQEGRTQTSSLEVYTRTGSRPRAEFKLWTKVPVSNTVLPTTKSSKIKNSERPKSQK